MKEQRQDKDLDHSGNTQDEGVHGLGLITLVRCHSTKVGDYPEEGVVGVGNCHSACADGHACQAGADRAVQSKERQQGCHNTGRGCKGDSGGTLCGLEDGRKDEGEENSRVFDSLKLNN